jgi:hypothetical protein
MNFNKIEVRNHPSILRLNIQIDKVLWIEGDRDIALEDTGDVFYTLSLMNCKKQFQEWCRDNLEDSATMTIIIVYTEYDVDYYYYIIAGNNGIYEERLAIDNQTVYQTNKIKDTLELPENTKDMFQSLLFMDFTNEKWDKMYIDEAINQCIQFNDSEFIKLVYEGLKETGITNAPLDIRNNNDVMYYDIIEDKFINIKYADDNIKQAFLLIVYSVVAYSLKSIIVFNVLDDTLIDFDKRIRMMDFIKRYSQFILIDYYSSQYKAIFVDTDVITVQQLDDDYVITK